MKTQISTLTKLKVWTVVSLTAKDTLMVILESFKQGFAVEATSKSMAWTTFDTFASVAHGLQVKSYLCFRQSLVWT